MQAAPSTSAKTSTGSGKSTPNEIEEISKKISEHADAIYRTWKSHGLAPTELLEFYTSAAAAAVAGDTSSTSNFFASSTKTAAGDDTTEGLQKLVNTFVIKDKEQRGVKAASKSVTHTAAQMPGEVTVSNNMAVTPKTATAIGGKTTSSTKPVTHKSSAILLKQTAISHDKDLVDAAAATMTSASKKKIARTLTTTTSANKVAALGEGRNGACAKSGDDQKTPKKTPKLEVAAKSTGAGASSRRSGGTKQAFAKLSNENRQPQQEPKQLQLHPQSNGSTKKKGEGEGNVVSEATTAGAVTVTTIAAPSTKLTKVPKTTQSGKESGSSKVLAKEKKDTKAATEENIMATMPTPTKVVKAGSRTMLNGPDKNLGRPILTRGSVAERVLMFEKCPDARNSFLNIKRPDPADAPPKSLLKVKLHATPPVPSDQNSLQREFRSTKSVYIPRFYFPHGKPQPQIALERTLRGILSAFDSFPNNQVTKDELPRILKLCGIPFYWRMPVMVFCQQGGSGLVERQRFVEFWKQMNVYCHEAASRFVYILSRGQRFRNHIIPEDLAPLVQDVVDTHPGLAFLKEATEFHSRYVHTVIARIFYSVNRSWSGKITMAELKKSDLLEMITLLEEEDDINQIMAFFSYEHFYVIYCKFWELDKDHDLLINQDDLARHSDHALSTRIVERIFSGCVTRGDNKRAPDDEPKMSYTDFVWFLLSEEDKRTPTAIEYWFRCMDVDGDGVLSMYELEYFYEEQQQRMESIGIETLPFEDCLCQMLDMIKPQRRDCVTLGDLKRCKMTHVFFDTFFNLEKYLDHEQRDPFASQRDEYSSDWDRFAAQEYELLITEEND